MISLLLTATLAAQPAQVVDTRSCYAKHFAPQVSAFGAPKSWKTTQLPEPLKETLGERVHEESVVADGYVHRVAYDKDSDSVYVIQTGGFKGEQRVFGPFKVETCPQGRA